MDNTTVTRWYHFSHRGCWFTVKHTQTQGLSYLKLYFKKILIADTVSSASSEVTVTLIKGGFTVRFDVLDRDTLPITVDNTSLSLLPTVVECGGEVWIDPRLVKWIDNDDSSYVYSTTADGRVIWTDFPVGKGELTTGECWMKLRDEGVLFIDPRRTGIPLDYIPLKHCTSIEDGERVGVAMLHVTFNSGESAPVSTLQTYLKEIYYLDF